MENNRDKKTDDILEKLNLIKAKELEKKDNMFLKKKERKNNEINYKYKKKI